MTLQEIDRDGVTIDVCKTCRGLWLDRGELEKLIARTTAESDEYDRGPRGYSDGGDRRDEHDHRQPRRKKSWFESLGDIFD